MTTIFTTNYSGDYGKYYEFMVEAREQAPSVANNTSGVIVYLYLRRTNVSSNGAYNLNGTGWSVTIDGETFTGTSTWDTRNTSDWQIIGDASKTITHNADGSKTITISASHTGNSATGNSRMGNASGSGTLELYKIPRASTIKATDANIGSTSSIYITAADNSFTHTITYSFGNLSGTVVNKTQQSPYPFTVPTSFYAQIPNDPYGVVTLTCTTYSGNTAVGTSQTTFKAYAPEEDNKPKISATIVDTNTKTTALTGNSSILVKNRSTAKVTVTATAQNSATIKSITVNGKETSNNVATFTNVTDTKFTIVATDSRNFPNTLNKVAQTDFTMIDYIPLTLSAEFYRIAATSSTVKVKYEGKYFNSSFSSSVANSLTVTWGYKLKGASSYTTGGTLTPTKSGNSYGGEVTLGTNFDYQQSYDFIIYASDKLTSLNIPKQVPKGEPIFDYGVDANKNNYLNVNGGLYVKNQAILDLVYPVGAIYMSVNNVNPKTLFGGTWVAWGTGRVPVGVDSSQTEFNSVEKTGGYKSVDLSINQMPKHTHIQNAHNHNINEVNGDNNIVASGGYNNNGNQWGANFIYGGQPGAWGFTNVSSFYTRSTTATNQETGGGEAHTNLQPYITCYMFKRIS